MLTCKEKKMSEDNDCFLYAALLLLAFVGGACAHHLLRDRTKQPAAVELQAHLQAHHLWQGVVKDVMRFDYNTTRPRRDMQLKPSRQWMQFSPQVSRLLDCMYTPETEVIVLEASVTGRNLIFDLEKKKWCVTDKAERLISEEMDFTFTLPREAFRAVPPCALCYEALKEPHVSIVCGHTACAACWASACSAALRTGEMTTCPFCRSVMLYPTDLVANYILVE